MAAVQVRKVNAQIEMVQACLGGTGGQSQAIWTEHDGAYGAKARGPTRIRRLPDVASITRPLTMRRTGFVPF